MCKTMMFYTAFTSNLHLMYFHKFYSESKFDTLRPQYTYFFTELNLKQLFISMMQIIV